MEIGATPTISAAPYHTAILPTISSTAGYAKIRIICISRSRTKMRGAMHDIFGGTQKNPRRSASKCMVIWFYGNMAIWQYVYHTRYFWGKARYFWGKSRYFWGKPILWHPATSLRYSELWRLSQPLICPINIINCCKHIYKRFSAARSVYKSLCSPSVVHAAQQ